MTSRLFAQEEVGLAVEGGVLVEQLGGDVGLDGAAVVEPLEVQGDAAAEEVGPRLVGAGVAGVEEGRFPVVEGLQGDLGGAAAEEGAFLAQDFPFHEADVGAAEDEEDVARAAPLAVPSLLEEGGSGAGLDHPLELVEGEDELAVRLKAGPAGDDGVEGGAPALRGEGREEGLFEDAGGFFEELADLQGGRRLFAYEVEAGPVFHELEDELALADAAAAVDGDEGAAGSLIGILEDLQLRMPSDEFWRMPLHSNSLEG